MEQDVSMKSPYFSRLTETSTAGIFVFDRRDALDTRHLENPAAAMTALSIKLLPSWFICYFDFE